MRTNRISEAQYAFLRDVRDSTKSLADFQKTHHVEGKRFSRWMRGTRFRRALTEVMRSSKRQRRLQLRLAAGVAAAVLAEALRTRTPLEERLQKLAERVLDQGRKEEQAAVAEQRGRGRGRGGAMRRKRPSPDDDLCHPNAKEHEDELLAILQGDDEADGKE